MTLDAARPERPHIVDVHTHGLPRYLPSFANRFGGSWPELVQTGSCTADILFGGRHFRSITDHCWDPQRRLEDMDADGVAMQVVSPIPITFSYGLNPEGVATLSRIQNEWIAGLVRDYPSRFGGLGTVPLQDPARAAEMAVAIVRDLKLAGVEIGSNVDGRSLDDPSLEPFFAACAEESALIFVHPCNVLGADRLSKHGLAHSIGMGAETAAAAASLVLGGVLDRHPGLKILLAHGGGAFLGLLSRIDRIWECVPQAGDTSDRPSSYVGRFYYDSLVFDPDALAALIARVGADRVAVGTDYPFVIAERPAGAALFAARLTEAKTTSVTSTTATTILGLSPDHVGSHPR